jgi:hypothetical protein
MRTISQDPEIQHEFELMVAAGTSERLAEMFALQCPPMSKSDREFLEGHVNGGQFAGQEAVGDALKSIAAEAGVNTQGMVYLEQLARFPGDPEGWVSGRGDVKKRLEQRPGWSSKGMVEHSGEVQPPKEIEIAEDLVQDEVAEILTTVPDPHLVDTVDLANQVREARKPSKLKSGE